MFKWGTKNTISCHYPQNSTLYGALMTALHKICLNSAIVNSVHFDVLRGPLIGSDIFSVVSAPSEVTHNDSQTQYHHFIQVNR